MTRRRRISRFVRGVFLLVLLGHVCPAMAIHWLLRDLVPSPWQWILSVATSLVLFFAVAWRARATWMDRRRNPWIVRFLDIPMFVHLSAVAFALVPMVLVSVLGPLSDFLRGAALSYPTRLVGAVYLVGLLVCGYGILLRRRWVVMRRADVFVAGLHPDLDGLRIVQLSDLHIGALTPRSWGERWASAANREMADLVVITGDLVTSGVAFHGDIADVIGSLTARMGVAVAMGNHDYFGEGEPLISLLRARGAWVLRNEGRVLARGAGRMYLAAIDDTWTRRDDLDQALSARPAGMPTLLLAHDPKRFADAVVRGVELTLSGHTHGGQVALPFFARHVSLSHLAHRYHLGFYREGASTLYVHGGLGTTGPPIRLGVPPEIAVFTLRAANPMR